MFLTRSLQAHDPRDRVFALLGIFQRRGTQETLHSLLVPNYQKTAGDVFRDATRFAIVEEGNLKPLCMIHQQSLEGLDSLVMPSWAVDIRERVEGPGLQSQDFDAGGLLDGLRLPEWLDEDPNCMVVKGLVIDEVTHTSPPLHSDAFLNSGIALLDVLDVFNHNQNTRLSWEVFVHCLGAGEAVPTPNVKHLMATTTKACVHDQGMPDDQLNAEPSRAPVCLTQDNLELSTALDYRMFRSGTGLVGRGPRLAAASDIVVALRGGILPFVLRPFGEDYRLLGPCYVVDVGGREDIMLGQAMREHKASGGEDTVFRIR